MLKRHTHIKSTNEHAKLETDTCLAIYHRGNDKIIIIKYSNHTHMKNKMNFENCNKYTNDQTTKNKKKDKRDKESIQ